MWITGITWDGAIPGRQRSFLIVSATTRKHGAGIQFTLLDSFLMDGNGGNGGVQRMGLALREPKSAFSKSVRRIRDTGRCASSLAPAQKESMQFMRRCLNL